MRVFREQADIRAHLGERAASGRGLGLVPTMGFLHEGHRTLIDAARLANDLVAVSLFVNPTQFGPSEDFERYPRDLERDLALCERAGVDWVYAPEPSDLYPDGPGTLVVPPESLTAGLCGAYRPGHFTGVATVVAKLFGLFRPARAYFGAKDFQQVAVVKHLARDLQTGVSVEVVPTRREPDGVAMSSRNVYLSPAERERARALPRALAAGWRAARQPGAGPDDVREAARSVLAEVPGLSVQYVEVVAAESLAPATTLAGEAALLLAVHAGRTRLIDNTLLSGPAPPVSPALEGPT